MIGPGGGRCCPILSTAWVTNAYALVTLGGSKNGAASSEAQRASSLRDISHARDAENYARELRRELRRYAETNAQRFIRGPTTFGKCFADDRGCGEPARREARRHHAGYRREDVAGA